MSALNWNLRFPSARMTVMARHVVATSQPLAAQAGLDIMRRGGNAVDAALACAITLTVVEPTSNGIGSDAFAVLYVDGEYYGFNGSGRSPQAWSFDAYASTGMPELGWGAVTVPGAVDTWVTLSKRFGKLPFGALFESAIRYAQDGYMVSPITAASWQTQSRTLSSSKSFQRCFMPRGQAPCQGETVMLPDHGKTLAMIAQTEGEAFYRGVLAETLVAQAAREGGQLSREDLAAHAGFWVEPIQQSYGDVALHEIPPNGQGLAALVALGVLRRFSLRSLAMDSADGIHLQLEAMKAGFRVAFAQVADPDHLTRPVEDWLRDDYLDALAARISMDKADNTPTPIDRHDGTVYLSTADDAGNMVSFIQSNYAGFGSGVVVDGTGIALHNRGAGFSTIKGHPNQVDGGKRPFHTIIPGFVTRRGEPVASFGVMGGHAQTQGHVQMMVRMFDYGVQPQAALDAPRWHVKRDFSVLLEEGYSTDLLAELEERGHVVARSATRSVFGGGQIIMKHGDGYLAASDPRKDGCAVGF